MSLIKQKTMSEELIINYLKKIIKPGKDIKKAIGDDAAVIRLDRKRYLLYTCDMIIEGTHFSKGVAANHIGYKAFAAAASDIAAMGGIPKYATLSIGLQRNKNLKFIKELYRGILSLSKRLKINIVGGDTNRSDKITVDVSMIGFVEKKNLTLRSSAKKGDLIFVTGALGGSIYGRHLHFTPRIKEARFLVKNFKIHSMIDLSDGLAQDLYRLIDASNTGALIKEELIPISKDSHSLNEALTMGEDFELLFTISKDEAKRLEKNQKKKFSCIGEIRDKKFGLRISDRYGNIKQLDVQAFRHF